MKTKKSIILLFMLFMGISNAMAGYVPGYMGKRFSAGVNGSSFFLFDDFTSVSDMIFSTRFSYKSEFTVNYTVARKISLGAGVYYGQQCYIVGDRQYYDVQGDYHYVTLQEDYLRCKLMIYELNMKIYQKNFIAPIGPYHQFAVGLVKYNAVAPNDELTLVDAEQTSSVIEVVELKRDPYSCFKLSYHIGYSAPVFSSCYLNLAIGTNFFRAGDSAKIRDELTDDTFALGIMNKNLRRHNFFEVKIGFGWLAF